MTPRALAIGWVLIALVFLVLGAVEFTRWRAITNQLATAAAERQRLAGEILNKERELTAELRKHSRLVGEIQATPTGSDPSTFLRRLAGLARDKKMTIMAVGSLERQATPQFTKSWHAIQVRAPYREIREFAAQVEQDRGILEDFRVEPAKGTAGQSEGSSGPFELQASFKLAALELSPQAKLILQRTLAASAAAGKEMPGSPLSLPVPAPSRVTPAGRDPFVFLTGPAAPSTASRPAGPAAPVPDLVLKGIVSFPEGFLAIVNDQIVKVGDTVSGYRVQRITDSTVTLTVPNAAPRTIELPEVASAPSAAPRR